MILQTGLRTDIPAFYSGWFANRLQAGFVCVRNPYNPISVTRYILSPKVIDPIGEGHPDDQIHEAKQKSWIDRQMSLS